MRCTSKIDELLDRTVRKDGEAKKWRVIVGFVLALLVACCLFYGLFIVTEPIVKNHYNTLDICILYDFYDERVGLNETAVYFIGNSIIGTATYAPLIDEKLMERGYNISAYNCYIDGETPQMIALQIDSIIESRPSLVVYGISYSSFTPSSLNAEKLLFSKDRFTMTDELSKYYTEDELLSMQKDTLDLRGYLGRVIFPTNTRTGNYDTKEPIGIERRLNSEKSKNHAEILDYAENFNPIITNESSREKDVFVYAVKKMENAGIPVIIINLPIHPLVSDKVSDETRQNYFDLLNSTGAMWIDMETMYGDEHFFDYHHTTFAGAQEFSMEMVELIIEGVENNVIHYA